MTQSKNTMKAGNAFKVAAIGLLAIGAGFSGATYFGETDNTDVLNAINAIETTAVADVNVTVETDLSAVNAAIDDLNKKVYSVERDALEISALIAYDDEYDSDDLEDFLEDSIVGFDKLKNVELDDDETEVTITNLGLDDDEDKTVLVTKVYDIKYENDESTTSIKDKVYATAIVTYDEDDGFESEIEFSLA